MSSPGVSFEQQQARLGWWLCVPALAVIVLMAIFPIVWTVWESLHIHDLRLPQIGSPFVGLANYTAAASDARFWDALGHTVLFTAMTVSLELTFGLLLALVLHRTFRGRGLVRTVTLLPWAVPTVIAAIVWRFLFEGSGGGVNELLTQGGFINQPVVWFGDPVLAWIPIVLADVWKTSPFVALLLLAGLQQIDTTLYEAARVDGAGGWAQFWSITLPLLRPAILVAVIFRTLDAFRVFDLIYVLTAGGPGTVTEPIALYTHTVLLQYLRFGFGSAMSVIIFLITFGLALVYIRLVGVDAAGAER